MKLMVINGVNMNMLAYRETDIYGAFSYEELVDIIRKYTEKKVEKLTFFVSNFEGEIVEQIHKAVLEKYDAIIINPAAFSHYSYAIHDALLIFKGTKVEVHLSDVENRDEFRKNLVTAHASDHVISGFQENSYLKAVDYVLETAK